ncbi:MAG TPA: SRPBCC family protein [Cyclobacteriaceae bacterium]|nr:SRPBCC family protein [Cyclobacteriaceae bacterium]
MKILKYSVIVIVVILILFFSIGLAIPNFEYSTRVQVHAAPEKCWKVMHDTSRMKKWLQGFVSLTLIRGENFQPGSLYEIVLVQDKEYRMQETIKEVRPPEWVAYLLSNDVMISDYNFKFTGDPRHTEIEAHYSVSGKTFVWRSVLWLSKSMLQSKAQEQLNLLKAEIETGS